MSQISNDEVQTLVCFRFLISRVPSPRFETFGKRRNKLVGLATQANPPVNVSLRRRARFPFPVRSARTLKRGRSSGGRFHIPVAGPDQHHEPADYGPRSEEPTSER